MKQKNIIKKYLNIKYVRNKNMKKVLIFGAVKHAIEKAKELGYETIVVD